MRTASLRLRVVLGVLLSLAAVLAVSGVLIERVLGAQLRGDLQQRLVDRAEYGRLLADRGLRGSALADALSGDDVRVVYDVAGQVFVGRPGGGHPGAPFGPPPAHAPLSADTSVTTTGHDVDVAVEVAGGRLTVSGTLAPVQQTLDHLRTVEVVAGVSVLAVTALLLLVVVPLALRPLTRMTALAGRIARGARGGRLRPANPRTELGRTAAAFDDMLAALEAAESDAHAAAEAARAAEERMRRLLADVSHELRTPIAAVQARAETLLRDNPPRATREDLALGLVRETRRAARLVDDLLLVNRLDQAPVAQVQRRPVDLADLVAGLVVEQRLLHDDLDVMLQPAPELVVDVDPERVTQVVTNLLDNARHATADGGAIRVEVAREDARAVVTVDDDGPGVPEGERERVFDRFVRLDVARSRRDGGSGLGLPIARALARAHGGDLRCEAPPTGRGARFVLTLPLPVVAPVASGTMVG